MKKFTILFCFSVITSYLFAQVNSVVTPPTKLPVAKGKHLISPVFTPMSEPQIPIQYQKKASTLSKDVTQKTTTERNLTTSVIGSTVYDLQSNGSISTRLWNNAGKLSAAWTYSDGDPATSYPDRGTGYAYYDGTTWSPQPTARIESQRTGYTNIVVNGTGGEVVVAHNTTAVTMQETWRATQGSGAWTENLTNLESPTSGGNLWSKETASGNNVHVIALTTPSGALGGDPFHGQDGALVYSRSIDGGQTFDIQNEVIPGIDSSNYLAFSADEYQIDANGNNVAIVVGDLTTDLVLLKSIDNGSTWTKTVIWTFPVPFYDGTSLLDVNGDQVPDTILTNDQAPAVLVDNQGKAHVWFGAMYIVNDGSGIGVFLGTNGLLYWDESMPTDSTILCAESKDLNQDDSLDIPDFGRYSNEGICSQPSPGIDQLGNLYVTYSAVVENTDDGCGKSVRHTYVSYSTDGGQTWSAGKDISPDPLLDQGLVSESSFGAMAKTVDANINVIFEQDFYAGLALSTDANGNQFDECNIPGTTVDIVAVQFPVADLTAVNPVAPGSFNVSQNIPNPATDQTIINVTLSASTKVKVDVYDMLGQNVLAIPSSNYTAGVHQFTIDCSNLVHGVYFYEVNAGDLRITKKMIVD